MGVFTIRLPDVGEGVAEAELVEWNVKVGDTVLEDEIVGAVMTDKAAVEIPTSVSGKVIWLGGEIGDVIAVGAELIRVEVEGEGNIDTDQPLPDKKIAVQKEQQSPEAEASDPSNVSESVSAVSPSTATTENKFKTAEQTTAAPAGGKPLAAPSIRKRARDQGLDLRMLSGSGPAGRILHEDLDNYSGHSLSLIHI